MDRERLDQIITLVHQNKTADEISKILNGDSYRTNLTVGLQTESHFEHRAFAYFAWMISDVEKSTNLDDARGVDYFITLNTGERFPVQVKSSDLAVLSFKQDKRYIEDFKKRIIVINSAHYVSKRLFKKNFLKEVGRVRDLDMNSETRLTKDNI